MRSSGNSAVNCYYLLCRYDGDGDFKWIVENKLGSAIWYESYEIARTRENKINSEENVFETRHGATEKVKYIGVIFCICPSLRNLK